MAAPHPPPPRLPLLLLLLLPLLAATDPPGPRAGGPPSLGPAPSAPAPSARPGDFERPRDPPPECPERCECGPKFSPHVGRAAKTVACPPGAASELPSLPAAGVEVLLFRNHSVRRVDFFALKRAPGLLVLDLAANGINQVVGSGKRLPRLSSLDLSLNNLHIIQPFSFRDFPELEYLNLSWNGLHTISPSGLMLPNLNVLDLSHNRLSILKEHYFIDIPALKTIYLSNNILSRIPAFVFGRNLHTLALARNHIIRLEENALEGINITGKLDLSSNALRRIPNAALKRSGRIDNLILDNNIFSVLAAGSVVGLNVRKLSISRQKTLQLVHRGALSNLEEVEEILIRENPLLSYIHPEAVVNTPHLRVLDLSNNNLFTIEEGIIRQKGVELRELRVGNNSFPCHCSLKWVQERMLAGENENTSLPSDEMLISSQEILIDESCEVTTNGGKVRNCKTDSGVFCSEKNGTRVDVASLPRMPDTCIPYIIPLYPSVYHDVLGSNVSFHCRALGSPDIKIHWFSKSGTRLFNNECAGRLCVREHTLTIHYLHHEDGGAYTCVARNSVGVDARAVRLLVRDVNVQLFPLTVTSTFVTLAWNMSSAISNSYTLRYEAVGRAEHRASVTFTVGLKLHSYTVHGLQPHSTYDFSLCIQREDYLIQMSSIRVTTKGESFLLTLGIQRSYLSVIVVGVALGAVLATCAGLCGLRCWRQRVRLVHEAEGRKSDSLSGRSILQSSSTHSDMAFITYINLSDDGTLAEHTESHLGYA
ncbi:leucine-rich repeat neuronal protein 3-like [Hetaerina americana]|uniref:leucine-rich repeat neuronal protein 3-like n=1 Tax=Hetaerina americana TaxID=62018 RepID=UPI003A7F10C0